MLYFQVCSKFRLFLCAVNINESIVSIISSGSRHGKLTVYDSTTEQQTVLLQNFKYYMSTCRQHDRNFSLVCRHEKRSWWQPYTLNQHPSWTVGVILYCYCCNTSYAFPKLPVDPQLYQHAVTYTATQGSKLTFKPLAKISKCLHNLKLNHYLLKLRSKSFQRWSSCWRKMCVVQFSSRCLVQPTCKCELVLVSVNFKACCNYVCTAFYLSSYADSVNSKLE